MKTNLYSYFCCCFALFLQMLKVIMRYEKPEKSYHERFVFVFTGVLKELSRN